MYYYFSLTTQLANSSTVVVPSGNFGNLTAGLFAKKTACLPAGRVCPFKKFIAAVNKNSVIPKYLRSGKMENPLTKMTYSNAMDVGKPSNWARIRELYDYDHDDNDDKIRKNILKDIEAITVGEAETKKTIKDVYKKYNYIIDPHTAVGVAAALTRQSWPAIVLSTAHPAKFKEIVESAIGKKIALPKSLAEVSKKQKKSILIGANYKELYKIISQ